MSSSLKPKSGVAKHLGALLIGKQFCDVQDYYRFTPSMSCVLQELNINPVTGRFVIHAHLSQQMGFSQKDVNGEK